MNESCIGTRTIVTIYLMNPTDHESSKNLINEHKLCGQTEAQPKSNVHYFGVPYADPISSHLSIASTQNTTVCDGIIIYARPGDDPEVQLSLQRKIIAFCLEVRTFKNTIIFYEMSKDLPVLTHIQELLISNDITGVTCLHIHVGGSNMIKTYTLMDNIIVTVPVLVHSQRTELICVWWFQYYVGKVFGCGKGRLTQQEGTCYINSVVNGIILSKDLSSMVLMYMNMAISSDRTNTLLDLIKIGASPDKCPTSSGEILFLFRIMYSIYCKDIPHTRKRGFPRQQQGTDVLDYFTPGEDFYAYTGPRTDGLYKKGGNPLIVIYKMLNSMRVKFAVNAMVAGFFMPQVYDVEPKNIFDFLDFIRTLMPVDQPLSGYDVILRISSGSFKFEPILPNIEKTITVPDGTIFDLQYCVFSIYGPDDTSIRHSIVGYFCNGQPQTYDSATNSVNFLDWTKLNTPEVLDAVSKDYFAYRPIYQAPFPVIRLVINFCVYLNRTKIPEYTHYGICPRW